MEIIEIYTGKVKEVVSKKEFIKRYNKSVDDKKDNYSLVDTTQIQPQRNNYKTFTTYWKDTSEYLKEKYRYTYGSKKEKEKA
jgi:ribosomal protein L11